MLFSRRAVLLVALLSLGLFSARCGPGRWFWSGQAIAAGGLQIAVNQVYVQGHRLHVLTTFFNQSQLPVMVNRDGVALVLPNGRVVQRRMGGGTLHVPYIIHPGAAHQVFVEFDADNFRWRDFPVAQVSWSNAVTVNGAPVMMPPTLVRADL